LSKTHRIQRYYYELPNLYLLLTKNGIDVQNDYPAIYKHLDSFGDSFKTRGAKGQHWTNLRACAFFDDFKFDKIVWIELTDVGRFAKCQDEVYLLNSAYFLITPKGVNANYLLSILNSTLIKFYLKQIANTSGVGTTRWINNYVKEFPIILVNSEIQEKFGLKSNNISAHIENYQKIKTGFYNLLASKFNSQEFGGKLENWHELDFKDFLKELSKAKVTLSLPQEAEWMQYFNEQKQKVQQLKSQITQTDREIDQMVYQLYELTEEEIKIIENI